MTTGTVRIVNKLGLHARAASKFIQIAKSFACSVEIGPSEDKLVNGKSIMNLMTLTAAEGTRLILKTDGEEHDEAFRSLRELIDDRFGEPE